MARKAAKKTAKKKVSPDLKVVDKDPNDWVPGFLAREEREEAARERQAAGLPPEPITGPVLAVSEAFPPTKRLPGGRHEFQLQKGLPPGAVTRLLREKLGQGYSRHTYNVETGVCWVSIPIH